MWQGGLWAPIPLRAQAKPCAQQPWFCLSLTLLWPPRPPGCSLSTPARSGPLRCVSPLHRASPSPTPSDLDSNVIFSVRLSLTQMTVSTTSPPRPPLFFPCLVVLHLIFCIIYLFLCFPPQNESSARAGILSMSFPWLSPSSQDSAWHTIGTQ